MSWTHGRRPEPQKHDGDDDTDDIDDNDDDTDDIDDNDDDVNYDDDDNENDT